MNTSKKLLMVASYIVLAACAVVCIYTIALSGSNGGMTAAAIFNILTLLAVLFYISYGVKKDTVTFFRIALTFCAISALVGLYCHIRVQDIKLSVVLSFVYVLWFGIDMTLAYVKNLGKKVSYTLAIIALVLSWGMLIAGLITHPGYVISAEGTSDNTLQILRYGAYACITFLVCVCEHLKYKDKAARGTK